MSGLPKDIPGLGRADAVPRQNKAFTPGQGFGSDDYFVWSRCDGTTSLRDIILMTGFPSERTTAILQKLRDIDAIDLTGAPASLAVGTVRDASQVKDEKSSRAATRAAPPPSKDAGVKEPAGPSSSLELSVIEEKALGEDVPLSLEEKLRILSFRQGLATQTHFEVLGTSPDADKRTIKRAYFRLSKEFHPDRFFGKELGSFAAWGTEIFEAITGAFRILGDNKKRAAYEASLRGEEESATPQTKEEHGESLFVRACELELGGDLTEALKYFAASLRMSPKPRFYKRAAMCAVTARELSLAEDYAKKAAHLRDRDASYWRVLSDVYRASKRLEEAKMILQKALALNTENDVLFGELKMDLAAVDEAIAEHELKIDNAPQGS